MSVRPTAITVFALYLLIVFGISSIGSLVGAVKELPPYSTSQWLVLTLPKVAGVFAGFAFWKMLRVGAGLWAASVLSGWAIAYSMATGYFPTFNVALAVTTLILALSIWIIHSNWDKLLPRNSARTIEGANNA